MSDNMRIQEYIFENLFREGAPVNTAASLKQDLGLDSISIVQVLSGICDHFEIDILNISDLDLINLNSVNDLITLITEKYES